MNNIALLTIIIALVYAAIGLSTPLVTLYLQSLGADYSRIAIILATTAAVALVSSYLWGRVSDAWPPPQAANCRRSGRRAWR